MEAVEVNEVNTVSRILESGLSPNDVRYGDPSPLIRACDKGYVALVNLLIENGADVNYQDDAGDSPLICAAVIGSDAIVQTLIANDVNVNAVSRLGSTALETSNAAEHGRLGTHVTWGGYAMSESPYLGGTDRDSDK